MTVEACSRPLIMRVMIIVTAQASADTSGKNAAGWNALVPGRRMISTPARPTTVASHRRKPTLSPRNSIDSAVTNSGETNPVAEASAIGRYPKPVMNSNDDDSSAAPRNNCRLSRSVRSAKIGEPGTMAGVMISAKMRNRIQAISIEGSVVERYFAVASEVPRNSVGARISAMPRNGRSVRGGAILVACLSSGKGNEALSSFKAVVGRVTAGTEDQEEIESGEPPRKRNLGCNDKAGKQEADMREPDAEIAA